jgi:hypothetical protein
MVQRIDESHRQLPAGGNIDLGELAVEARITTTEQCNCFLCGRLNDWIMCVTRHSVKQLKKVKLSYLSNLTFTKAASVKQIEPRLSYPPLQVFSCTASNRIIMAVNQAHIDSVLAQCLDYVFVSSWQRAASQARGGKKEALRNGVARQLDARPYRVSE